MLSQVDKENFRKLFWAAAKYEPTVGEFPIYDLEGKLVTTSYGQAEIHADESRIKQITGGVRAGKSKVTAMDSPEDLRIKDGLMWIVGPDYEQTKPEFKYIMQGLSALGMIDGKPSIPERGPQSLVTVDGFRIQTKSSDDLETLASFAPDKILIVEAGQQEHGVIQKAAERALEKNAKIIINGTLEKSMAWYAEKWEEWSGPNDEDARSFSLPSWSNTVIFPEGRTDPKIKALEAVLSPEIFLERCAAIPCKPSGLVFPEFDRKRHVRRIDFNPALPVELAIDPATHTYAIEAVQWEQRDGQTYVYVIDEIYTHDMIAQDIIPMVRERPWFRHVKGGVIDIAGTHRQANKSQVQIWMEETGVALRSNYVFIEDSIDVVRLRLRGEVPLIVFDYRLRSDKSYAGKANGILAEMGLYRWPEWKEGQRSKRKPIDGNNDGLKALGYWLYDRFGPVEERKKLGKMKIRSVY